MFWITLAIATVVVVLMVVALALIMSKRRSRPPDLDGDWPYQSRNVLTTPEQVIYHRLVSALPECLVFAQVELSRVLKVTQRDNAAAWHAKISGKSLDFVVCLKDSSVVAAIEIDDSSHHRLRRVKADDTRNRALQAAGVPLLRWQAESPPDEAAIRAAFTQ
jgi:hypothetical protein